MSEQYSKELKTLLGTQDPEYFSKTRILIILDKTVQYALKLRTELFCADPNHQEFLTDSEETLAELRRERIRRKG
jgi:hypothetical protein